MFVGLACKIYNLMPIKHSLTNGLLALMSCSIFKNFEITTKLIDKMEPNLSKKISHPNKKALNCQQQSAEALN
jgi:hypothetical protein